MESFQPQCDEPYEAQRHVDLAKLLRQELEAASLALSANQLAEFCDRVATLEVLCLRLERTIKTDPKRTPSDGRQAGATRIDPRVQAVHVQLAVANHCFRSLVRRCRRSANLLNSLHRAHFQNLAGDWPGGSSLQRFSSEA